VAKIYIVVEVYDSGYGSDEGYEQNHTVFFSKEAAENFARLKNKRNKTGYQYRVEEHEVIE